MATVPEKPIETSVQQPAVAPPLQQPTAPDLDPDSEVDELQRLFEDISEAQGRAAGPFKNVASLAKHMQRHLYPLLSRSVGVSSDLRVAVRNIARQLDDESSGYMPGEDVEFILGYISVINAFVLKYSGWATQEAQAGRPDFQRELMALHQGGLGLKRIVETASVDVDDVEED